ncbi:enoyl-ACP reductase FabI [Halomonas sp. XH26]|uniref:enoyl-ACP reductase FabI n=1 Tax=Halomonadaceae TaxID=28256 RepID=UPI00049AA2C1|nr:MULTISPECIES: enoyl-ACP reductase FabI [unclassified Halomonas]AIA76335.1 short-chain dehydrogenase [Halomonas campaniensis]MCD6003469.1 enoyl-ACP reductase FabI [Halomonas sp. IOP_6]MCD6439904.1 enoyl-ACP reductase FabI [Halomonas sp.]UTA78280.1 enoyl-ACP reductase FabI [Halomonas sp. XH26]
MLNPFSMQGKVGIVAGLANQDSIAFGCAQALHHAGAECLVTYASPNAEKFVTPLVGDMGEPELMLCDVQHNDQLDALFARARKRWGRLDFVVHSIAYAPLDDLHGRVVDCSKEGFALAMDISCHSFIRMAKHAEPLMKEGGSLFNMTYYGAEKVVDNYNLMGPVKAALESATRYMAAELGPQGIRVHAVSPGAIRTRAASGLKAFDELAYDGETRSPLRRLASVQDVGNAVVYLASDAGASLTGLTHYVDAGHHIRF